MKKLLILILSLGMIFAATSCDSSVESLPTIDGENELPLVPID